MRAAFAYALRSFCALGVPLVASALLGACERQETRVFVLEVSRAGQYQLQGKAVPESELKYELKAAQSAPGTLVLHISADPMASFESVGKATKAAQDAGVGNIAFVTSGPAK